MLTLHVKSNIQDVVIDGKKAMDFRPYLRQIFDQFNGKHDIFIEIYAIKLATLYGQDFENAQKLVETDPKSIFLDFRVDFNRYQNVIKEFVESIR